MTDSFLSHNAPNSVPFPLPSHNSFFSSHCLFLPGWQWYSQAPLRCQHCPFHCCRADMWQDLPSHGIFLLGLIHWDEDHSLFMVQPGCDLSFFPSPSINTLCPRTARLHHLRNFLPSLRRPARAPFQILSKLPTLEEPSSHPTGANFSVSS